MISGNKLQNPTAKEKLIAFAYGSMVSVLPTTDFVSMLRTHSSSTWSYNPKTGQLHECKKMRFFTV